MAIVCCFACRSQPTTFISASFVPSFLVGYRKVYSGRRGADVVMSSLTPDNISHCGTRLEFGVECSRNEEIQADSDCDICRLSSDTGGGLRSVWLDVLPLSEHRL